MLLGVNLKLKPMVVVSDYSKYNNFNQQNKI